MDNVLFQKTIIEAGEQDREDATVLYCTEEVNFVVISIVDDILGTVPIAISPAWEKHSMVESAVTMGKLPAKDIIELASALKIVKEAQDKRVELTNGKPTH